MDTVQNSASSRLYTKLAALRKTLSKDERDVFDHIIPAEEEVTAHRFKKQAKARTKKAPEVTGHTMAKTKTKKTAAKASAKKSAK